MSIITDALKKAEGERESKAKQILETKAQSTIAVAEEEIFTSPHALPSLSDEKIEVGSKEPISEIEKFLTEHRISTKHMVVMSILVFFILLLFLLVFVPKKTVLVLQTAKGNSQSNVPQKISHSVHSDPRALPYVLSGISKLGDNQYAIINGMIVQKGDSIDGAHVQEILAQEVTLSTRAGVITLKMK